MQSNNATFQLSPDQQAAYAGVMQRVRNGDQVTVLAGLGGSGKSVLASMIASELTDFAVVAPTNRAVAVLKARGIERAQTLHSLIRRPLDSIPEEEIADQIARKLAANPPIPLTAEEKRWCKPGFTKNEDDSIAGVICDEASMCDAEMFRDLVSLGVPLVFVGDHGQLPPVSQIPGSAGWSVVSKPTFKLETIHRNAGDIRRFALHLRNGGLPAAFRGSDGSVIVARKSDYDVDFDETESTALAWSNKSVLQANQAIRDALGFDTAHPVNVGERVISDWQFDVSDEFVKESELSNPDDRDQLRILRGTPGTVVEVHKPTWHNNPVIKVRWDTGQTTLQAVDRRFFTIGKPELMPARVKCGSTGQTRINPAWNLPVRYGWCTTVHKAQGSEWDTVVVLQDMQPYHRDWKPWAYTAASRAKKKLVWLY